MSQNFKNLGHLQEINDPKRKVYVFNFSHRKNIKDTINIQKLEHFSGCIRKGLLPDWQILEEMAINIDKYIRGNKQTLDSAFGLKTKPNLGNAANVYKKREQLFDMYIDTLHYMIDENLTKTKAAGKAIDLHNSEMSIEGFLKTCRRLYGDEEKAFLYNMRDRKKNNN